MKRGELLSAITAVLLGGPLVFFFAQAMADGHARAATGPMRALFGEQAFGALDSGVETEIHYMGNDRTVPDFELKDQYGKPWRMADQKGKKLIMNFWTITCGPCVEEMPTLIELAKEYEGRDDVEIVAISVDQQWADVASLFPGDNKLTVLFDPDRSIVEGKFGTRLFPETWFVNKEGVIRMRYDGGQDWSSPLVHDLIETL